MKKLVFFITNLLLISTTTPPLSGMDCLLRFCCCAGKPKAPVHPAKNVHRIEAIRKALINAQTINSAALRELYLKCNLPEYVFSRESQEYLEMHLFIDHEGAINPQDLVIILSLLQPSESCLDTADWYYYQRVIDFCARHPEPAATFRACCLRADASSKGAVPPAVRTVLHNTYALIEDAESISVLEKRRISGMMPASGNPIETFTIAQPSLFTSPPIRRTTPYGDE
jgi:hypothetical protein